MVRRPIYLCFVILWEILAGTWKISDTGSSRLLVDAKAIVSGFDIAGFRKFIQSSIWIKGKLG